MAKKTIIQHAVFGGAYASHAAPVFSRIVGVLSVSLGNTPTNGTPFVHINFDDTLTSYTKLVELYITLTLQSKNTPVIIYPYNTPQREELSKLFSTDRMKFPPQEVLLETFSDFTGQERIPPPPLDILLYLARPDEASVRLMTKEGAVAELEETKRAVLNLLEDTRESEEKITAQAADLAKALEDSRAFARSAEEERATYHQLVSSIGEGVIVLGADGLIKIVNDVTVSMIGEPRESLINKDPVAALHLRDRERNELPQEYWDAILKTEKTITLPILTSVRNDGTVIYASSIAAPIVNETTKEHKGIIITFRNISEDFALDEARTNFISTASHQLRTPLTTIRWFIEMLQSGDAGALTEGQKQYLHQIDEGIARMINLVGFLLRTARVETNRVIITPKPLSLRKAIEACVSELMPRLKNKKQTVSIAGDDLPEIPLDPDYVHEVFLTILMNAQLYGIPGDTIYVQLERSGNFVEVHITDHGMGIAQDERKRVFDKFFRSNKAIVASPDGSGLGLSLVRMLVSDWGGNVWFESEEDKGTTFSVSIPVSGMNAREGEVTLLE
ncbi:MAG TPA: ATP-binding protein [Candidatus Paceibacterota bacterium]|nr:ATP-binding protein [Candidatus Paceibacterota bacterium]